METLPEGIVLYAAAALTVVGLLLGGYLLYRASRVTPEERERQRRAHVCRVGRVTEARILEIFEDSEAAAGIGLIAYSYEVRGVEYEATQDVRFYRGQIALDQIAAGHLASIKYDSRNPTNSILLSEEWSGL